MKKLTVLTPLLILLLGSPIAGQSAPRIPNLQAHDGEGISGNDMIQSIQSDSVPEEGNDRNAIDGNVNTFVRHRDENVTFTIDFKQPIALKMFRVWSDIVDSVELRLYSGSREIATLSASQPFQSEPINGDEYELYCFRYHGSERVSKATVTVDYYSDQDERRHRMHYIDFLVGGLANTLQLTNGNRVEGELDSDLLLATLNGPITIPAREILSVSRGANIYRVDLHNGSRIQGIPGSATLTLKTDGGAERFQWHALQNYAARAQPPHELQARELVLHLRSESQLVVQLLKIEGRMINMQTLAPITPDVSRVTGLTFTGNGRYTTANLEGVGDVLLSQDARIQVKFGTATLEFNCADVIALDRNLETQTSSQILENVTL